MVACKKENKVEEPVCRFSMIGSNGGIKSPVTYPDGDTIAIINDGYGYTLYFNKQGRLLRKEKPLMNPYQRYDLVYDNFGQVSELKYYGKQGGTVGCMKQRESFIMKRERW
jgi:hypothetical protein